MRILATLAAFGLAAGTALAATKSVEQEQSRFGRQLYCYGDLVLSYAMSMEMEAGGIAYAESAGGITCKFFARDDVWYVESFAFKRTSAGGADRIIFDEFVAKDGTKLYRWRREDVQ